MFLDESGVTTQMTRSWGRAVRGERVQEGAPGGHWQILTLLGAMTVDGLVQQSAKWTWDEMHQLEQSEYAGDIHCVTTWSKLGTRFGGVSVDLLLAQARPRPEARYVLATSTTGYTTNLPLAEITGGKAWIAFTHEGEPLSRGHGGPARLLVPHLYFWKSAKWVTRLTLLEHDQPGFWERNGYHDLGDPWTEQRYQGD